MISEVGKGRDVAVAVFRGLSTDDKPTNVANGAEFLEIDTGDIYFYNEDGSTWARGGAVTPDAGDIKYDLNGTYGSGSIGLALQNVEGLVNSLIDGEVTPHTTLAEIHAIVQSGEARNVFRIGDRIVLKYNDGSNDYNLPWDIVHFGDVLLQDGETVPGMVIQSHYAMQACQFDQNEGFFVIPSGGYGPGTYQFKMGNNWGSNVVKDKIYNFTTTESYAEGDIWQIGKANDEISGLPDTAPANWRIRTYKAVGTTPAGLAASPTEILTLTEGATGTDLGTLSSSTKYGTSGLNNMQRSAYGYNRWSQSGIRQFLNSSAAAGGWWTPKNPYDRRPTELASVRGFMAGFDEAFLNIIKPIKVVTALNTVSDVDFGTSEYTYDTFFLPSLEEEYIVPQLADVEGPYWEYWKRRLGLTSPQAQGSGGTNPAHIRYRYDAKTSAVSVRLRSAYRGYAGGAWNVTTTGYAGNGSATSSTRPAPACVIC